MKGQLRLLLLKYLQSRPLSGYALMKEVERNTGWKPSFGAIYPILKDLHGRGLVTVKTTGRQKNYTLTSVGKKEVLTLQANRDQALDKIIEQMKIAECMHEDAHFETVIRMLQDLKQDRMPLGSLHKEAMELRDIILSIPPAVVESNKRDIKKAFQGAIAALKPYAPLEKRPGAQRAARGHP